MVGSFAPLNGERRKTANPENNSSSSTVTPKSLTAFALAWTAGYLMRTIGLVSTTTIVHPRLDADAANAGAPVRPAWQGWFAVTVLAVAGFAAGFSHVWDSDVPWHLACGEWMIRNGQIMGHDYFSIDPQAVWVNVHWLFQVIVAALHSVAGDAGLSWLKALVCAGGLGAFGLALRRHVPAGWLIFAGMLMLYVFQARVRVRPELFTLALLIVTIALADSVRRGASPSRLWWMVPIMLFWVNMHGLFFLGLAIFWGFILGGAFDAAWDRWITRRGAGVPPARGEGILPARPEGVSPSADNEDDLTSLDDQANGAHNAGGTPARHAGKMPAPRRRWWTKLFTWRDPAIHGQITSLTAIAAALAATGVCLITPWPDQTALHPLLLSTRIDQGPYSRIVTELKPLVEIVKDTPRLDAAGNAVDDMPPTLYAKDGDSYIRVLGYRVYDLSLRFHTEALLLLGLAVAVMIMNVRRVPVAHWIILTVLTVLAFKARRNVGLLGPMAGFLLALHGGALLAGVRAWKPTLARVGGPFAVIMGLAILLLSAGYLTGTVARFHGHGPLPGAGRQPFAQADGAAQWLGQLQAPGDVLAENFGDGGVFIYWANHGLDQPRRLSYMDGRLEAHTLDRFNDMDRIRAKLSDPVAAATDNPRADKATLFAPLPPTVRYIFVNGGTYRILSAMMQTPRRFKLRYIDPCGVIFERLDWQPPADSPPQTVLLGEPNWDAFDRPLNERGLLDGDMAIPRTWWRQNVPDVDFHTGYMFAWLGTQNSTGDRNTASEDQRRCSLLAIRHLNAAWTRGVTNRQLTNSLMARAYHWRSWQNYIGPSDVLPSDLHSSRALHLFADVQIGSLTGEEQNNHREQWALALDHAGQMDTYFALLEQWKQQGGAMKGKMTEDAARQAELERLREAARRDGVHNLPPLERALTLASLKYRLTDEAIAVLEAELRRIEEKDLSTPAGTLAAIHLRLGDLHLRKGDLPRADAAYRHAENYTPLPGDQAWQLKLRRGLVDWTAGARSPDNSTTPAAPVGLFAAIAHLEALAKEVPDQPIVRYYLAIMHEDLGHTARAKELRQSPDVTAFTRAAVNRSHDMMLNPGK